MEPPVKGTSLTANAAERHGETAVLRTSRRHGVRDFLNRSVTPASDDASERR